MKVLDFKDVLARADARFGGSGGEDAVMLRDGSAPLRRFGLALAVSAVIVFGGMWLVGSATRALQSAKPGVLAALWPLLDLAPLLLLLLVGVVLLLLWLWFVRYGRRRYRCPASERVEALIAAEGLYESERDERGGEHVVSSARFSVSEDEDAIVVCAWKDLKYLAKVRDLDAQLSAVFDLPLDGKEESHTYVRYTFKKKRAQRLGVDASGFARPFGLALDSIPLNSELSWRFASVPHGLIIGGTGSGKTRLLTYLLLCMATIGDVYVCDPKNADLAGLGGVLPKGQCAVTEGEIARAVRLVSEEMERRYAKFAGGKSAYGTDWRDWREDDGTPLEPLFLCFDEFAAFSAIAEYKVKDEVEGRLFNIILKGRQAGVNAVLVLQRPDSNLLPTIIRDNLGMRVGMGNLSDTGVAMLFGSDVKREDLETLTAKGEGYLYLDGLGWDLPHRFAAPFVPDGLDFLGEFERLYCGERMGSSHASKGYPPRLVEPEGDGSEPDPGEDG